MVSTLRRCASEGNLTTLDVSNLQSNSFEKKIDPQMREIVTKFQSFASENHRLTQEKISNRKHNFSFQKLLFQIKFQIKNLKPAVVSKKETDDYHQIGEVRFTGLEELVGHAQKIWELKPEDLEDKIEALKWFKGALEFVTKESISKNEFKKKIEKENLEDDFFNSFIMVVFEEIPTDAKEEKVPLNKIITDLESKIRKLEGEIQEAQINLLKGHQKENFTNDRVLYEVTEEGDWIIVTEDETEAIKEPTYSIDSTTYSFKDLFLNFIKLST